MADISREDSINALKEQLAVLDKWRIDRAFEDDDEPLGN
jgi:hypothetical protein